MLSAGVDRYVVDLHHLCTIAMTPLYFAPRHVGNVIVSFLLSRCTNHQFLCGADRVIDVEEWHYLSDHLIDLPPSSKRPADLPRVIGIWPRFPGAGDAPSGYVLLGLRRCLISDDTFIILFDSVRFFAPRA